MNDRDDRSGWQAWAACRGHNYEMTEYQSRPLREADLERHELKLIARFCHNCPVTDQCLSDAYRAGKAEDLLWIRGGLRPLEVRRGRRSRGRRKAASNPQPQPQEEGDPPVTISQEKAAERVRHLLAQAGHHNTSDVESEAFFAKAFELMEKFGLEEAAIRDADPTVDPLTHVKIKLSSSTWRTDITLGVFVGKITDVAVLRTSYVSGYGAFVNFYGRASNVGRAVELFNSLVVQANVAAARRRHDWHGYGDVRKWTASVREGYIVSLGRRLEALHRAKAPAMAPPGAGLVPVSLAKEAEDYAEAFSTGKARRSSRSVDAQGWSLGRSDGNSANLGSSSLAGRRGLGSGS